MVSLKILDAQSFHDAPLLLTTFKVLAKTLEFGGVFCQAL